MTDLGSHWRLVEIFLFKFVLECDYLFQFRDPKDVSESQPNNTALLFTPVVPLPQPSSFTWSPPKPEVKSVSTMTDPMPCEYDGCPSLQRVKSSNSGIDKTLKRKRVRYFGIFEGKLT